MVFYHLMRVVLCVSIFLWISTPAWAGAPTEKVKQTTDKILSVVSDPGLKGQAKDVERKKLIRKAVDERFDWEEMSRRSLGRHWSQRTEEEKKEFVSLFGQLLERSYLDKVEGYSGEKVMYQGESLDGAFATVDVKILTAKNVEVPVQYRLRNNGSDWFVYDISIEGVSLVNNYRVQFSNILGKSPYSELVKKLKEKSVQE
jgi:phospholipid transport system substrate-binding protein